MSISIATPQRAAHLRMLTTLGARTHHARERVGVNGKSSKDARPVLVRGVRYDSVAAAARALHMARPTLMKYLDEHKPEYRFDE